MHYFYLVDRREESQSSKGRKIYHSVLTFCFHPIWVEMEGNSTKELQPHLLTLNVSKSYIFCLGILLLSLLLYIMVKIIHKKKKHFSFHFSSFGKPNTGKRTIWATAIGLHWAQDTFPKTLLALLTNWAPSPFPRWAWPKFTA